MVLAVLLGWWSPGAVGDGLEQPGRRGGQAAGGHAAGVTRGGFHPFLRHRASFPQGKALELLTETRRRLYAILAEEDRPEGGHTEA